MTEDKNKKTTCTKNCANLVLPRPTAKLIAAITDTSASLVKKVNTGDRNDKSENAQLIKYCTELIVEGQQVLVQAVSEIISGKKQTPSQ
ncbi:hypothetical protein [Mucilaginibacter sp.]|uniref:hypothetical protein n=1 Tax=Mucilaginibacter sp. TaxID=1882438 RepID=UPI0025DE2B0F|nr:hypothetical protein [Mucilaginibacter sp.]